MSVMDRDDYGPQECGHRWAGDHEHVCIRFVNHLGAHICRCAKSVAAGRENDDQE